MRVSIYTNKSKVSKDHSRLCLPGIVECNKFRILYVTLYEGQETLINKSLCLQ